MDVQASLTLTDRVLATLRAHEPELKAAGIYKLSLFGSVARGDVAPDSDVGLLAELNPQAGIGLFRLVGLEQRLSNLLSRPVDLTIEPVKVPRLRAYVMRDRLNVF